MLETKLRWGYVRKREEAGNEYIRWAYDGLTKISFSWVTLSISESGLWNPCFLEPTIKDRKSEQLVGAVCNLLFLTHQGLLHWFRFSNTASLSYIVFPVSRRWRQALHWSVSQGTRVIGAFSVLDVVRATLMFSPYFGEV